MPRLSFYFFTLKSNELRLFLEVSLLLCGILCTSSALAGSNSASLLLSSAPDRANAGALNARELSSDAFVFVAGESITKVDFYLDGRLQQTERNAPYDFAGTRGDGDAVAFDTNTVKDGFHDIRAEVTFGDGSSTILKAAFHVSNYPWRSEGFGASTSGGLGGRIIKVTNLNDQGAGSLRAAIEASGRRVVVFEVAGIIWLTTGDIHAYDPFLTIAGETAPSPGISVANGALAIHTHDVIVRHLRMRVGDDPSGPDPDDRDGIKITRNSQASTDVYNVLIDHCSVSWAIDEGISTWYDGVHDITIRDSILAEQLSHSTHPPDSNGNTEHSKALLIGDHSKRIAVIGNLFAHNNQRNPYIKGDASAVVINNLIYDPGTLAMQISDPYHTGSLEASIVGNVMLPGPGTAPDTPLLKVYQEYPDEHFAIYVDDNTVVPTGGNPLYAVQSRGDIDVQFPTGSAPLWPPQLALLPGTDVTRFVLANAGARPGDRDEVDARIVAAVRSGGGRIIDSQNEVGGFSCTQAVHRSLSVPANPDEDDDGDGRSNLEEWLAGFAGAALLAKPDIIYTSGFEPLTCPWAAHAVPPPPRRSPG